MSNQTIVWCRAILNERLVECKPRQQAIILDQDSVDAVSIDDNSNQELTGRELLLSVALDLFMDQGYEGVSIQQIATAAHMTKGSPYYHFKSKEDLFIQSFQRYIATTTDNFLASMDASLPLPERLTLAFDQMMSTINPGTIRMMDDFHRLFVMTGKCNPKEFDDPQLVIRAAYERAFAESGLELRLPPAELAEALVALQMGVLHMRIMRASPPGSSPVRPSTPTSVPNIIDLFLNGAIASKPA